MWARVLQYCVIKFMTLIVSDSSYLRRSLRSKLTSTESDLWENITHCQCGTKGEFFKLCESWLHRLPTSSQSVVWLFSNVHIYVAKERQRWSEILEIFSSQETQRQGIEENLLSCICQGGRISCALRGPSSQTKNQVDMRQINRRKPNLVWLMGNPYRHGNSKGGQAKWGTYVILK